MGIQECGRCGQERECNTDATYVDFWADTKTQVRICDECSKDLDSRKMFSTKLPMWCCETDCSHYLGTVYYTGTSNFR